MKNFLLAIAYVAIGTLFAGFCGCASQPKEPKGHSAPYPLKETKYQGLVIFYWDF